MSRITPPVTKLSHAVRSLASTSRQSGLRDPSRHAVPLSSTELPASTKHESYHTQSHTLPPHRPTSTPTIPTIPLMQGFRTSAPPPSPIPTTSTMDFITLPPAPAEPPLNPFSRLRVPLLPDNYAPDRSASSAHAVEQGDAAVAGPEIHVVSHGAGTVAALSEVVGNEAEERAWGREFVEEGSRKGEPGVLRELWGGIVEDLFGKEEKHKLAV